MAPTLGSPAIAQPKEPVPEVFVGYVHGEVIDLNYPLYTHLCHAFVTAEADGRVLPNERVPDSAFVAEAHSHGVRVLLSVGGWGWDAQFAAMVLDGAAEHRYVEAVLTIVDENDYDGIDLDWEYPDSREEIPGFQRLAERLRAGLDAIGTRKGRSMELTMAAAAHPRTLAWLPDRLILETLDWVNVMTYDYAGGWTAFAGHHAPLQPSSKAPVSGRQSIETTFGYLLGERGLPPERFALGLPLYGRAFAVGEPYASTADTKDAGRAYTHLQVLDLAQAGWTRHWDAETQTPWLFAPERNIVLGYDDAESIRTKTRWAKRRGLRGVFFWEVSQDRNEAGDNTLQVAAKAALTSSSSQ